MEENVPSEESGVMRQKRSLPVFVVMFCSVVFVFTLASCNEGKLQPTETQVVDPFNVVTTIAKWKGDKRGAFTLSFDDSMISQADVAVPAMLKRGLVGTWFINPGKEHYQQRQPVWEQTLPAAGHELANHTMHHEGAANLEEAEFEIGETARIIWSTRPAEASKLLSFQRGGATDWILIEEEWKFLDERYHLVHRVDSRSMTGASASDMMNHVREALDQGGWVRVHFHGIGGEWSSVETQDFLQLLDYLITVEEDLWIGTYGSIHKYIQERDAAKVAVLEASKDLIRIRLTAEVPSGLYDEPLTLITGVPQDWTICEVTQSGQTKVVEVVEGILQYEAVPGFGVITLVNGAL